ncbi:hypothetical protein DY000_02006387 [Brassica cretica]|uniref:Uncharacterized protein n=1 Tax=Brassica cretica TaxID=69181 RepID=A0ABQ7C491_BRACR|nr:hypothetical protein DY000_02006387 [Brassica cretica]
MVCVDRRKWMSVDRFRVVRFVLSSTVASCNDSCIIDSSGDRLWLLDWVRVLPVETLSSSMGSSPSSEGVLIGSGGCSEGLGHRCTSIDGGDGCRSILASECRSTLLLACRSIQTLSGLGGCGCFAANSSRVRIFTALKDAVDSVGVVDRCSGTPVDRFELVYVDRCSVSGVD